MQLLETFQVKDKVNPTSWNERVGILNGLCFHLHEWSLYRSKKYNSIPLYFYLEDVVGEPCSIAFGHLTEKRIAGVSLNKRLALSSLPASRDRVFLKKMLEQIVAYCARERIVSLEIGSFGTPLGTEMLGALGFSLKNRWEFILDIDMHEEELWMTFNPKKRNKIKKGQKSNWNIIRAVTMEHVMQFRGLALETQKRKNEQGIAFPVAGEKEYSLLKNMVMDVGLGRLYLALDKEDQPVAAAFFVGSSQSATAYYMLSSANRAGLRGAAPDLLLWTAITDFQKDSYRLFNFGGVSESELAGQPLEKSGLYTFKKAFSPEVCPCGKGIFVLRPKQKMIYGWLSRVMRVWV